MTYHRILDPLDEHLNYCTLHSYAFTQEEVCPYCQVQAEPRSSMPPFAIVFYAACIVATVFLSILAGFYWEGRP